MEHEDVSVDAFTFREKCAVCFDFTAEKIVHLIWIINQNVNKQI